MMTIRVVLALALIAFGVLNSTAQTVHPEIWPAVPRAVPRDPKIEKAINELLAKMSLEEKVGQVIQASITAVTPADVKAYHLG